MKKFLLTVIAIISCFSLTAQSNNLENKLDTIHLTNSPINLVKRQLKAYNSRNIESFLEPYDDDVEAYIHATNKLAFKGKDAMRKLYSEIFKNTPNLHCELINRIVQGNTIIDKECVLFGEKTLEAVAIYYIENNKIKKNILLIKTILNTIYV